MSYVGGKLKLKGKPLKANGGVEKKKKKEDEMEGIEAGLSGPSLHNEKQNRDPETNKTKKIVDFRTEAEKRRDKALATRKEEGVKKLAEKSYRQRVEEYNKYLSTLSEHHDIPKVGPG